MSFSKIQKKKNWYAKIWIMNQISRKLFYNNNSVIKLSKIYIQKEKKVNPSKSNLQKKKKKCKKNIVVFIAMRIEENSKRNQIEEIFSKQNRKNWAGEIFTDARVLIESGPPDEFKSLVFNRIVDSFLQNGNTHTLIAQTYFGQAFSERNDFRPIRVKPIALLWHSIGGIDQNHSISTITF